MLVRLSLESHRYNLRKSCRRDHRRMPPLMKPVPIRNEPTSGAGPLDESGVHPISHETREAIAAAKAKLALRQSKAETPAAVQAKPALRQQETEDVEEPYRRPVRASNEDVCPKMLEAHISLVHQVVAPIARRVPANVLRDDLLAAGIFGLVDSLRKNGGDSGTGFEWYARTRIRGAVLDELRVQDRLTRRARDAVNAAAEREENETDGITVVGLDELSVNEEQDFLASPELDPASTYEAKETLQILAQALDKLPEREREIVGMYYFEGATFKTISTKLKVSEPRVFQLHARALERLSLFIEKRERRPILRNVCRDLMDSETPKDAWIDTFPMNDAPADVDPPEDVDPPPEVA